MKFSGGVYSIDKERRGTPVFEGQARKRSLKKRLLLDAGGREKKVKVPHERTTERRTMECKGRTGQVGQKEAEAVLETGESTGAESGRAPAGGLGAGPASRSRELQEGHGGWCGRVRGECRAVP